MEIVKIPTSELKLDPNNLRAHGPEGISMIKKSLEMNTQYRPLIVDKNNLVVLAGNGRLQAMRELGWNEADCILVDSSEHEGLEVIDNRLNELSAWKDEKLNDWLIQDKGLDWWGVDSQKSLDLLKIEKKKKKNKQENCEKKKEKKMPLCPCCGKPLKRKKINLL